MTNFSNRASYFARNFERTAEFKKHRQTSLDLKKFGNITNIMEEERLKEIKFNDYHTKSER